MGSEKKKEPGSVEFNQDTGAFEAYTEGGGWDKLVSMKDDLEVDWPPTTIDIRSEPVTKDELYEVANKLANSWWSQPDHEPHSKAHHTPSEMPSEYKEVLQDLFQFIGRSGRTPSRS